MRILIAQYMTFFPNDFKQENKKLHHIAATNLEDEKCHTDEMLNQSNVRNRAQMELNSNLKRKKLENHETSKKTKKIEHFLTESQEEYQSDDSSNESNWSEEGKLQEETWERKNLKRKPTRISFLKKPSGKISFNEKVHLTFTICCRTAYSKSNHASPMVAFNACDKWYHVDCINFTHAFVHSVPFFVCPNCIDMSFGVCFLYIRHRASGMVDLQIKDITEICNEHSSSNSFTQKLIKFHKYPSQYTKSGRIFVLSSLNILTNCVTTNRHLNCYIKALIQIILGSSVVYFLPDTLIHDSELTKLLLFVKKKLCGMIDMPNQIETKDRSSTDPNEPVMSMILKTAMNKDYRKKEMEDARFFLSFLLDKIIDDDTLCENPFLLNLAQLRKCQTCDSVDGSVVDGTMFDINVWATDRDDIIDVRSRMWCTFYCDIDMLGNENCFHCENQIEC